MKLVGLLSLLTCWGLGGCRGHERGAKARDTHAEGGSSGEGGAPSSARGSDTAASNGGEAGAGGTAAAPPCPTFDPDATSVVPLELVHPSERYEIHVLGPAGDFVYFIEGEAVRRIPVDGGTPETVGAFTGSWLRRTGSDELVWARANVAAGNQQIVRAPLDDPEDLSVIVEATPSVQHVVLDDSQVIWSTTTPHDVFRAPLAGGDPELLVGGGRPLGAVVHDGYYYWIDANSDHLERVPVSGGARELLARVVFGGPMTASEGAIFWGDTVLSTIEKWTPGAGREQLASAIDPLQLQVWGGTLYWAQGLLSGSVRSVAVDSDGESARDVLCRLRPHTNFHVTESHVWVGGGSGLLRLER